jgi:hypothetical protein
MNGYKLPRLNGDKNISNLRILETDLIYIVGIPYDQSEYEVRFYFCSISKYWINGLSGRRMNFETRYHYSNL